MIDNGWIKLHRKMVNWEWYNDSKTVHLFIHLLINANHSDQKWQGKMIKRGQLITGRNKLTSITGISAQSIRTSLGKLKNTKEVTIKTTNKYSLITVLNYDLYQFTENTNQQTNQQLTSHQPTTNQQLTTNKKDKKDKKDKNDKEENKQYVEFVNFCNKTIKRNGRERNWKPTSKIKSNYEVRLKEGYTKLDFSSAVLAAMSDSFHKDSQYKYLTPEFFTRRDKLERYANL